MLGHIAVRPIVTDREPWKNGWADWSCGSGLACPIWAQPGE